MASNTARTVECPHPSGGGNYFLLERVLYLPKTSVSMPEVTPWKPVYANFLANSRFSNFPVGPLGISVTK